MILLFTLIVRVLWRAINVRPSDAELLPLERKASFAVHWGLYLLLFALLVSGYLISTADGAPVSIFGWFDVPALTKMTGLETTAGNVHRILAYAVIALATIHALAALKHHFLDRSDILARMWSGPKSSSRTLEKGNWQ
jgi:cytochrome b561